MYSLSFGANGTFKRYLRAAHILESRNCLDVLLDGNWSHITSAAFVAMRDYRNTILLAA